MLTFLSLLSTEKSWMSLSRPKLSKKWRYRKILMFLVKTFEKRKRQMISKEKSKKEIMQFFLEKWWMPIFLKVLHPGLSGEVLSCLKKNFSFDHFNSANDRRSAQKREYIFVISFCHNDFFVWFILNLSESN